MVGFAASYRAFYTWLFSVLQGVIKLPADINDAVSKINSFTIFSVAMLGLVIGSAIGAGLVKVWNIVDYRWERMAAGDKVNLFIGVFAGILASLPIYALLQALVDPRYSYIAPLTCFAFILGLSSLAVMALRSMGDVLPWHSAVGKPKRTGFKILDTNVIIDGRIYDVARTGFLEGRYYIPKFVLEELQFIADSADPLRRQRGRRGLDVLKLMEGEFQLEVGTMDKLAPDRHEGVDARLVQLARAVGGELVTNDVNLNRVASLQQVTVLNLNDLAMALKPNILPREQMRLQIVREGSQPGQGVGYLDDGTMVVVENGKSHVGETHDLVVTQVIQTERGKMIFAELPAGPEEGEASRRKHRRDHP